jgi:hypothetical protein
MDSDEEVKRNIKTECPCCMKQVFQSKYSQHLMSKHKDDIRDRLGCYKKMKLVHLPVQVPFGETHYACFCCNKIWKNKASAINHIKTSPACTQEAQFTALYSFLGVTAPTNEIVIRQPDSELQAEVNLLKKQVDLERKKSTDASFQGGTKRRLEARIQFLEKHQAMTLALMKEKCEFLITRLMESKFKGSLEALNEITFSEDDKNALLNIAIDAEIATNMGTLKLANLYVDPNPAPAKPWEEPVPEEPLAPPPMPIEKPETNEILYEEPRQEKKPATLSCGRCRYEANDFYGLQKHDFVHCSSCSRKTCNENDYTSCYSFDCRDCQKVICGDCNKGNKLKPRCEKCFSKVDA